MKLSVRNDDGQTEPEVELWLERDGDSIYLRGRRIDGKSGYGWFLATITPKGIALIPSAGDELGFPFDNLGRLKMQP